MLDRQGATVDKMNVECHKGTLLIKVAELFDRHIDNSSSEIAPFNAGSYRKGR